MNTSSPQTTESTTQLQAKLSAVEDDLKFVERWANHHGTKPHMTAQEALSCIQHYPPILAITRSYANGKMPQTLNPYADLESAKSQIAELERKLKASNEKVEALGQLVLELKERNSHE